MLTHMAQVWFRLAAEHAERAKEVEEGKID